MDESILTKQKQLLVGICGLGVVGSAIESVFKERGVNLVVYDKFKNGGIGSSEALLDADMIFFALPTPYSKKNRMYDKTAIHEVAKYLGEAKYQGLVVLKSTVEPGTTQELIKSYNIRVVHNPEFLTARTAAKDFEEQFHIVIGGEESDRDILSTFYKKHWPEAEQSLCSTVESELMKLGVNCFYAVKIQFFNELYCLSEHYDEAQYTKIVEMMIKNRWIAPHHVNVPGPDGKLSYGGMCFPKDTNALVRHMEEKISPCAVLAATIKERNSMRNDAENVVS